MSSQRFLAPLLLVAALGAMVLPSGNVAYGAFHCMRVHAVMAGWNGNTDIQYVELRMNTGGQSFLAGHKIEFFDGAGTLKATFTFPSGASNAATGDSILIGTSEFNSLTTGGDADFTFTMGGGGNTVAANGGDALHPIQGTSGRVHFGRNFDNCDADGSASAGEVDSVAYGTGTALFGSAATALPSPPTNEALILDNLGFTPSDNSDEYALGPVSASTFSVSPGNLATDFTTPRNNSRTVLAMNPPPVSVGGVGEAPAIQADGVAVEDEGGAMSGVYWALLAAGVAAFIGIGGIMYRRRTQHR